jgi:Immunity protein 61
MSAPVLDRNLLELAREAGRFVDVTPDGKGLRIGESQVQFVVRLVDGVYTVEMIERGASNGVRVTTEERGAVERYLAIVFGHVWRDNHGLGYLDTTGGEPDFPPGYEIIDEGGWRFTVRWSQDGRDCRASGLNRVSIVELTRTLPFTLDEVIAAFKNPRTQPMFAPAAKRFWHR